MTETSASPPPRRHRRPPRPVEVVSVSAIAPRLLSVLVRGEALEGFRFDAPTSHVKLFLPDDVVRTYTPVRFEEASKTLELQFVLHGTGPASEWAERAKPGDRLAVAGPGGRFVLDETAAHWWLAADESAIPAVSTLLEALPAGTTADVHIEVADAADEVAFSRLVTTGPVRSGEAKATVTWHRRRDPGAYGAELAAAARAAEIPDGARIWVACEASAMRGIRRYFRDERGLPPASLTTRGYWRLGEADHPDHDYGED